ncbi:MAG: CAAD domain-containing protein [Chroococcidiopsis sp.]
MEQLSSVGDNNIKNVGSQPQQVEFSSPAFSRESEVSEPAPLAKPQSVAQFSEQRQRLQVQVAGFLAKLPERIIGFFNTYRQSIIVVALIVATLVLAKVFIAIVDVLNDLPLLSPIFELIGLGYSIWFVNRYLLKFSNRQELSRQLRWIRRQVVGG